MNGRHSFYDIQGEQPLALLPLKYDLTCSAARFKPTFEAYLGTLEYSPVRSLDELIKVNQNHAEKALPSGKSPFITQVPNFPLTLFRLRQSRPAPERRLNDNVR